MKRKVTVCGRYRNTVLGSKSERALVASKKLSRLLIDLAIRMTYSTSRAKLTKVTAGI